MLKGWLKFFSTVLVANWNNNKNALPKVLKSASTPRDGSHGEVIKVIREISPFISF